MKRAYYLLPNHTDIFRIAHWCHENGVPALFPITRHGANVVNGEWVKPHIDTQYVGSRQLSSIFEERGREQIPLSKDGPKRFVILRDEDVVLFRLRFA